jgi:hypothetical protein
MLGANRREVEGETLSIEDARNRPLGEITKLDEKCNDYDWGEVFICLGKLENKAKKG